MVRKIRFRSSFKQHLGSKKKLALRTKKGRVMGLYIQMEVRIKELLDNNNLNR